jgi:hypothetical protein
MWLILAALTVPFLAVILRPAPAGAPDDNSTHAPVAKQPLSVGVLRRMNGSPADIAKTIYAVSTSLQAEVDSRNCRLPEPGAPAKPLDATAWTNFFIAQAEYTVQLFREGRIALAQATSPQGSPELLRAAYATLLERVLLSHLAAASIKAPRDFAETEATWRAFVASLYVQLTHWPAQMRASLEFINGDSFELSLLAEYDVAALADAALREVPRAAQLPR